jgi:hypothetical protein
VLRLVEVAIEPVPFFGCALRECPAGVADVQLADRCDALPLFGPELPDRPRLLRLVSLCFVRSAPAARAVGVRPCTRRFPARWGPPTLALERVVVARLFEVMAEVARRLVVRSVLWLAAKRRR